MILANSTENLYGWRDNKRYIENQEFFRELEVRAVIARHSVAVDSSRAQPVCVPGAGIS